MTSGRGFAAAVTRQAEEGAAQRGAASGRLEFAALGTTVTLLVTDPRRLPAAEVVLRSELHALDLACSRFRPDSEIRAVERSAGRWTPVSPILTEVLAAALRAARISGGLVDPTVGRAVADLGYDRDFAAVAADGPELPDQPTPAPGWWRVRLDVARHRVLVPPGVRLDVGASAKAWAADHAARSVATGRCGALVSLGGDIALAGPAPEDGWLVMVGDDHAAAGSPFGEQAITLVSGGLATSGVTRRTWRRGDRTLHHIVDPRTGDVAPPFWRTVTVAAASCLDANTASTAAVVRGAGAPGWLAMHRLPARLVGHAGRILRTAGWPEGRRSEVGA